MGAIFSLLAFISNAQMKGVVLGLDNEKRTPLYHAKITLLNSNTGVYTEEDGTFELILPKELPDTMVISAFGYNSDTVVVTKKDRFISLEIVLYSDQLLPEVVVAAKRASHSISRLKTLHVEEIGAGELRKAACCNLSESFETNASIDVNITDAVSGAKKIQLMGLDGVYTQIQMENIPYLRGLESAYGLTSMPGTWVESIQITKGTGNVVNGYESMAGLVNLELKKPETMEKLYLNSYINGMGRMELNLNGGFHLDTLDKWSTGWFVHGSAHPIEMDYNKDGFRDMPNGTNLAVMNRYQYEGKNMESRFGFNGYMDDKVGGQINKLRDGTFYDVQIKSRHIDGFAKMGIFMKKPYNSIGLVSNYKYHTVDALFGTRKFHGEEARGYFNAIYDGIFGTTDHKYKIGASVVYANFIQRLDSLNNDRTEVVPGAFAEYTYTGTRLSLVAGIRGDYHNLYGFQYAPRLHTKYAVTEHTDLRLTGGKGWRVPNYMIDNISLMATSRTWIAPTETKPEVSWNVGGSLVQRFKLGKRTGNVTVDFYHTYFENQLVVDRDQAFDQIVFKNLANKSFSNSLQMEFTLPVSKTVDVRLAYKYLDVRSEFGGELQQRVMIPKHRGFANVAYQTRNKRWEYDLTCSVIGQARLPQNLLPDGTYTSDNMSEVYPLVSTQITHVYKRWDFYLGGENILNYRQKNPIIDAQNPFSSTFDATRIWAPIYGINVYLGIRFSIEQEHEENE